MAIKSDMSKAYDRVEWAYLRALLVALGFDNTWVERVMFCVSTVRFSALINDQPFGSIQPERGIRQGDPLSPFLFVLCTEGLIHLIGRAVQRGLLQGIQFSQEGPMIHHLLFADDSLMICKASADQAVELVKILGIYEKATGQQVNVEKSAITFGSKVEESTKILIKDITGISKEGGSGSYLGLPECFSGSKTEMLAYIYDSLKNRLSGWFAKLLSMGGKEVLLMAVAMAMPVYAMSCFKLTKKSCENLTKAMADFWWNSLEHKRKIHWLSWTKLCLAKEQGGLGFKDIQSFNQALLAKQAWRILSSPESLFAKLFKSRYFDQGDFLSAKNGSRPSYAWRSIQFGKELLSQGLRKHLGDGSSVLVWTDAWIGGIERRRPLMKNIFVDLLLKVEDLIDHQKRCWKMEKLEDLFYPEDIQSILSMKIAFGQEDYWVWLHNRNDSYSVKSGYWFINNYIRRMEVQEAEARPSLNILKTDVWKIQTAPKIKNFFWRALSDALPAGELLVRRGIKMDPVCQTCGFQGESINHIVFGCSIARQVWALSNVPHPENGYDPVSHYTNFHILLKMLRNSNIPEEVRISIPWIAWYLWKFRNGILFEGKQVSALDLVAKIKEESNFWRLAQLNDKFNEKKEHEAMAVGFKSWSAPPSGWLKCNLGVCRSKTQNQCGMAWVLRNDKGKVLLHSRRAFSNIDSMEQANFCGILWAVESMHDHHLDRVLFAIDDDTYTKVFLRPKAWPNFKVQRLELLERFRNLEWWRIMKENTLANRGAFFIAQSVFKNNLVQSYVAVGAPRWLARFFESEEMDPSV